MLKMYVLEMGLNITCLRLQLHLPDSSELTHLLLEKMAAKLQMVTKGGILSMKID